MTADNHEDLVAAAAGKSKRQVEELLVRYFPQPAVPSLVRRLPAVRPLPAPTTAAADAPAATSASAGHSDVTLTVQTSSVTLGPQAAPAPLLPPARRPLVKPLAPDRYEIRFTASAQTREKLRQAQDLLRHAIPSGDLAEVIDRALTVLLKELARRKFAATERPRASRGTAPRSRDIAAKVRRAVFPRDQGACAFFSKNGRRCNERAFIEFDHIHPHSAGGEGTTENIRLLCRAHNSYASELFYGRGRPAKAGTRPGKSWPPLP
jgi:hypothetical protein